MGYHLTTKTDLLVNSPNPFTYHMMCSMYSPLYHTVVWCGAVYTTHGVEYVKHSTWNMVGVVYNTLCNMYSNLLPLTHSHFGEYSVYECTVKTAVLSCAASSIDQSSVHGLTLKPATTLAMYD